MKSSASLFRAFCCGLLLLLAAYTAQAQIIYVTPNGAGNQGGNSWGNAAPGTQLQAKINGAASGSQVWVAAGTYKPTTGTDRNISFVMKEGVAIYGGFRGAEMLLNDRPAISYSQPSSSILSGYINGDRSNHIIFNDNNRLTGAAVLDGFTISGGKAVNNGDFRSYGGAGICNYESSPTIRYCFFTDNISENGGAVLNNKSGANFINCYFKGNSAFRANGVKEGGAMYNAYGGVRLTNCIFYGNTAGDQGGAIYSIGSSPVITNCDFIGNSPGAIFIEEGGNTILTNCIIWNNPGSFYSKSLTQRFGATFSVSHCNIDEDGNGFVGQNGNVSQDPLFVDAANGDFHLKPNSPLVNKGDNSANTTATDLDGNPRKYGVIDLGAYEFQCDPTTITSQPQNTSACTSGTATFTLAAAGPGLNYKWYKDGQAARSGSNAATLTINNVQPSDAGNYIVEAISNCGTVTSNTATLTVNAAPSITTQPVSANECVGEPASFSVAAQGTNLSYQWKKDGTNINGATNAAYSIGSVTAADAGIYTVVVGGICGSPVISNAASLFVNAAPSITVQPANVITCVNVPYTISVTAHGTGSINYEWQISIDAGASWQSITPSNASSITFYTVNANMNGRLFRILVSNSCDTTTSDVITLTVNTPPSITTQPASATKCVGEPVSFSVDATGTNLSYQWLKNGTNIDGATSATYSIAAASMNDAGNYSVVVSGSCGSPVTSSIATLTVNSKPVVTVPANIITSTEESSCGASVIFAATATRTPASSITYAIGETQVTSPYVFALGTTTVTAVATNSCGTDSKTFTVTVEDKTAPTFTAPANRDIALGINCSITIPNLTTGLSGSDNCGFLYFSQSPIAGTVIASGHNQTQVVTITADDGHGNQISHDVTLTAKDNTLPTITAPATMSVSTDAGTCSANRVTLGTPTYSDNCTGTTIDNDAPDVFAKGITTVTWTATDAAGNKATATQTVTVEDKEAPVAPNLPAINAECNVTVTPVNGTDNCAGTIVPTTNDALAYTVQGTYIIHWTYSDGNGNSTVKEQTVIIKDVTKPVPSVTSLPDVNGECSISITNKPTATDNCSGRITATTTDPLSYTAQGTYTIHWTYNDGNGNVTTQEQTVVIKDVTKPVADITALSTVTGECSATITTKPTATDNCAGKITATTNDALAYTVQGTYTIHWTYSDGNGNITIQEQTVIVKDVTKPLITAPAALTVSADAGKCNAGNVALGTPVTSDNCAVASVRNNAPAVFSKGETVLTWTVTDAAGNQATVTQSVTVTDNEKPLITCPVAPVTLCYSSGGTYTIAPLQASDNCGNATTTYAITGATIRSGNGNNASGTFNPGTSTIIWTVKDASNNTATCQSKVVVNSSLNVSIPDAKVLSSGVDLNTVYLGYTPAGTITLSATVSGGSGSYLYKWSTGANTASIKVSPTAPTTYTVAVTDVKGCTGMATKVVKVINVACGSKVNVCHKGGNTLCIDKTSVPDHLGHGDYLGACRTAATVKTATISRSFTDIKLSQLLELAASPNPSTAHFTLQIKGNADERVALTITDAMGRVIENKSTSTGTVQVGGSYVPGLYIATAIQGNSRSSVKLIKQ